MTSISRRAFISHLSYAASAIALAEAGLCASAQAETAFTIATTGGSWGEQVDRAFVKLPKFEATIGSPVVYSYQNDSIAVTKLMAQCGNPPFTTAGIGTGEAAVLGAAGCVQDYDLDLIPNYRDIPQSSKLPSINGLHNYWASHVAMILGLTWNTKLAARPTSYKDLWLSKYKGQVGIPGYGWQGSYWLYAVNRLFGGNDDDVTPGMQAISELVKQNRAVVIDNTDQGMQAFTQEEIVIAPFWNGRTFALQQNGVPVDIAYLPGSVERGSGFLIAKDSHFTRAANILVNNTLDPDLQIAVAKQFGYPPTNLKAKLPPELAYYALSTQDRDNLMLLDWNKLNTTRAQNLERWDREVLS